MPWPSSLRHPGRTDLAQDASQSVKSNGNTEKSKTVLACTLVVAFGLAAHNANGAIASRLAVQEPSISRSAPQNTRPLGNKPRPRSTGAWAG